MVFRDSLAKCYLRLLLLLIRLNLYWWKYFELNYLSWNRATVGISRNTKLEFYIFRYLCLTDETSLRFIYISEMNEIEMKERYSYTGFKLFN